ncbi:MAG TPA: ABC transporter permease [Chthonomonadaceae bacterium]|nr:ABC transporter permease [Chthonomonadaceae bacterium]
MRVSPGERTTSSSKGKLAFLSAISGTLAPLSFLLLLSIALWFLSPNFATRDNLKQIAVQAAVVAILACGQTAVIISGNIDLSVASVMAFAGVAAAQAMSHHLVGVWGGVGIACLSGLILGIVSGLVTAFGRIPSFIVTLGMMGIARGAAGIISNSVTIGGLPEGFQVFGFGELFGSETRDGIPYAVLMMAAAAVGVHVILARTRWGRALYAMGGNQEAARLSGINLRRAITGVFALSGLLAGFAAIVNVSRASVASKDAGLGYELDAVAATVVGGTSLFGGQGGIPGTIIGAFLIYTIRNGCNLRGLSPDYQSAIIGAVVILAVLYDRYGPGRRASEGRT